MTKIRTTVIPPPVDIDKYRVLHNKLYNHLVDISNHEYTVLFIGPLSRLRWSARIIVKALSYLRNQGISLRIIMALRDVAKRMSLLRCLLELLWKNDLHRNVVLIHKPLTEHEKVLLLNIADCALLPIHQNLKISSGMVIPPLTILEALACGTPVISTNTKSIWRAILSTTKDPIITFSSSEDLIKSLEYVLLDKNLRRKLSIIGRKIIEENFSMHKVRDMLFEKIYDIHSVFKAHET